MHLDTVRPAGSWANQCVPGASDYQRLDVNQTKVPNGDAGSLVATGTSPPSLTITGTPASSVQSLQIKVTSTFGGGNNCNFNWYLNGILQGSGASTVVPFLFGATGLQTIFPVAPYTTDNVYTLTLWTPTSPIYIGGSGLQLPGGSSLYGGVRTERGGSIVIGTGDLLPQYSPPRSRPLFMSAVGVPAFSTTTSGAPVTTTPIGISPTSGGLTLRIPSRYLHHNGTSKLSSITATAISGAPCPASFAASPPLFAFTGFNGSGAVVGPTYSPAAATVWAGTTPYTVGNYVRPIVTASFGQGTTVLSGSYFRCTHAGTSGSGPAWNFTPGSSTTDGGVTWLCIGGVGAWIGPAGPLLSATYNVDPIVSSTLDLTQFNYSLLIGQDAGFSLGGPVASSLTIIGFQFNFTSIADMSFY